MPDRNLTKESAPGVEALGDPTTVRGRLALLGWRSLSAWAAAHGHDRKMADYAVRTWGRPGHGKARACYGGITLAILHDLATTLAESRSPDGQLQLHQASQSMADWRRQNQEPMHGCGHMQGRGAA